MTCKLTVNLCSMEVELISVPTLGEMLHVAIRKRESLIFKLCEIFGS